MSKLKLHEKWLYRRKKYDKLSKRMRRTKEGAARFNELCCQDVCLQVWLVQNVHMEMSAMMEMDPKYKAAMKKAFKDRGLGKLFALHESIQEKGVVTVEQLAAALGMTVAEMQITIAANPALLKVWPIIHCL